MACWVLKQQTGTSGESRGSHVRGRACDAARPEAIADGEGDVVLRADVQDVIPVRVREILRVVQQAQLRTTLSVSAPWSLLSCARLRLDTAESVSALAEPHL